MILLIRAFSTGFYAGNVAVGGTYVKQPPVWGEELYFDGTKVRANADIDSLADRVELAAEQHVQQLFARDEEDAIDNQDTPISSAADLVTKYDGKRLTGSRKPWYQRVADKKVSVTDPDATPMKPSEGGSAVLGYHDHYVVDGGRERIILSALVTPASVMDNTPLLDLIHWVRSRWQLVEHPLSLAQFFLNSKWPDVDCWPRSITEIAYMGL